jgi:hemerythrin
MSKAGYPDIEEHIREHLTFKTKVREFEQKYEGQDLALTGELTVYLTSWVIEHFTQEDQKYVPALRKAGLTVS